MSAKADKLYIALLSIHGLIRGTNRELGRDADTGGQILYVIELAQALARQPGVAQVDLITRRVVDPSVSKEYAEPIESVSEKLRIVGLTPDRMSTSLKNSYGIIWIVLPTMLSPFLEKIMCCPISFIAITQMPAM